MRKALFATAAAVAMAFGTAQAQQGDAAIGVSAGYPGLGVHATVKDVSPAFDLRLNFGYAYAGDFSIGADVLYGIELGGSDLDADTYIGGGVGSTFGGDNNGFNAKVVVGAETDLDALNLAQASVFFEAGPTYVFDGSTVGADARIGINYTFPQ